MLTDERLLKLKVSLLSNYPERRRHTRRGAHHRRCAREGRTPLWCTTTVGSCNARRGISPAWTVIFMFRKSGRV